MKDFYDLWTIIKNHPIDLSILQKAISEVFSNRGTALVYPMAFKPTFYDLPHIKQRWEKFLMMMGKESIPFEKVIADLSNFFKKNILKNE